jgi:MYXO-CTERM domain-containing protein
MGCPCSSTPGQGPGGFPIALFLLVSVFLLGIKRRKQ